MYQLEHTVNCQQCTNIRMQQVKLVYDYIIKTVLGFQLFAHLGTRYQNRCLEYLHTGLCFQTKDVRLKTRFM